MIIEEVSMQDQKSRIIEYIQKYGFITSYTAYSKLGITQLATRISELKERGYIFKKERVYTKNRFGKKTHYDKYYLIKKGD